MYKYCKNFILLSSLLWFGQALADISDSPIADLHKGTLVLPCVYVLLPDGSTDEEPLAFDVQMNQRGGSRNWEVVSAVAVASPDTECPAYQFPIETEEELENSDSDDSTDTGSDSDSDSDTKKENCVPANTNANNCRDKNKDKDSDEEEIMTP